MTAASVAGAGSPLWYLSRATGAVTLLLLTGVVLLGVMTRGNVTAPGLQRFVVAGLHRNIALIALVLLGGHVVTAVIDPFAPIRLIDAVVPFTSAYRPVWLGLGAAALDMVVAVVVTSLLRLRMGVRAFRATHWLTYAAWPLAVVHGLGTGTDTREHWMLLLTVGCVGVVMLAVLWRATAVSAASPLRRAVVVGAALVFPLALGGWLVVGPLAPRWAARSGTPASLLGLAAGATTSSARPVGAKLTRGTGAISGTISMRQSSEEQVTVELSGSVTGGPGGRLVISLVGRPAEEEGGGVALSSGSVRWRAANGVTWSGPVTSLDGGSVGATLRSGGNAAHFSGELRLQDRAFTGTVTLR